MWGEGGQGVCRKICTTIGPLVLELLHFIMDIDGYELLDCTCFLTMKFIILLLFECIKGLFVSNVVHCKIGPDTRL